MQVSIPVVLAIGLFIYSILLFLEKDPIPTTFYILAKPEERKKMKTKAEYRFTGIVMFIISIILFLISVGIIFSIDWIGKVVISICIILVIFVLIYSMREVMKL